MSKVKRITSTSTSTSTTTITEELCDKISLVEDNGHLSLETGATLNALEDKAQRRIDTGSGTSDEPVLNNPRSPIVQQPRGRSWPDLITEQIENPIALVPLIYFFSFFLILWLQKFDHVRELIIIPFTWGTLISIIYLSFIICKKRQLLFWNDMSP